MLPRGAGSKIIVGFDLGEENSQISFYGAGNKNVETVSAVAGVEEYNIPTVLCKREGNGQWFYGREALRVANEEGGILVDHLLSHAMDGEPVLVDGEAYEPAALLSLFFKKSLGLLAGVGGQERIGAFLVTSEEMSARLKEILNGVLAGAGLRAKHVCFQDYEESFYQYMIHQSEELRDRQTALFYMQEDRVKVYRLQNNLRTTPVAVFADCVEYPWQGGADWDENFLNIVKSALENRMISLVYLIGDGFSQEKMKESLSYICRGRRVFLGNNLFSKGACLGMMERLKNSPSGKAHVFLGADKLKANIGMHVRRRGEDSYLALLDAGCCWYEAGNACEFYIQDGNSFELVVSPLHGRRGRVAQITLDGLTGNLSRFRLEVGMTGEDRLECRVEDLGFGEFKEATHQIWTEEFCIYEGN